MMRPHRDTAGLTIIELVVTMVIAAIVGAALLRVLLVQSDFTNQQDALRNARAVSQGALSLMLAELRMIEVSGGIETATATSLQVRIPYSFGIICGTSGGATTLSMLPTDSAALASAFFSGYAWRSGTGYAYETTATLAGGTASVCTADSVTTLAGGVIQDVTPTSGAGAGIPVFLFQRVLYEFKGSAAIPGTTGLWRTPLVTGVAEELAAPFNDAAAFRFYVLNADTAQTAPPGDLADLRGLELILPGESENTLIGDAEPKQFDLTAAVFFMNRSN